MSCDTVPHGFLIQLLYNAHSRENRGNKKIYTKENTAFKAMAKPKIAKILAAARQFGDERYREINATEGQPTSEDLDKSFDNALDWFDKNVEPASNTQANRLTFFRAFAQGWFEARES